MCGVPELKVPLASSGDTSLDRRDIMTPSRAFKKTKTRMEPQMYCIRYNEVTVRLCVKVSVCVCVCESVRLLMWMRAELRTRKVIRQCRVV